MLWTKTNQREKLHFEVSFKGLVATLWCFGHMVEVRVGVGGWERVLLRLFHLSPRQCILNHCASCLADREPTRGLPCTLLPSSTTCNSIRSCPESHNQVFSKVSENEWEVATPADTACLFHSPSQQHYSELSRVIQSAALGADNKTQVVIHSLISR